MKGSSIFFVGLMLSASVALAQNEPKSSALVPNSEENSRMMSATSQMPIQELSARVTTPYSFLGVVDTMGTPGDLSAMCTTTTVGLMYTLKSEASVGFGEDIETAINNRSVDAGGKPTNDRYSETKLGWTSLRYMIEPTKVLGSEKIFGLLRYYVPTAANGRWLQDSQGRRLTGSQGMLRADVEVPWMLTPHWTVSYYFDPRLNFVSQNDPEFDFGRSYARLNHYGYLYYVVNDSLKYYTYFGYEHRWGMNEDMHLYQEKAIPGVGVSKDLTKSVNLVVEATHAMLLVNDNLQEQPQGVNGYGLRPENMNFEVTLFALL